MVSNLQRVNDAATAELEPGEQIQATLPRALLGGSKWLPGNVFTGPGMLFAVVVTDRRLLLFKGDRGMTHASWSLYGSCPRSVARVAEFKPGVVFAKLVLEIPGEGSAGPRLMPLNVHMYQRKDARLVVAALATS